MPDPLPPSLPVEVNPVITVELTVHDKGYNFAMFEGAATKPFATGQGPLESLETVVSRLGADANFVAIRHNGALETKDAKFTADLPAEKADALGQAWRDLPAKPEAAAPEPALTIDTPIRPAAIHP